MVLFGLAEFLVLLATIVFFSVMGIVYFHDIITALLNGVILYFLLYRAYFDLKKGRWKPYAIGLAIGVVFAWILPPLRPLWDITFVVIVVFCTVEMLRLQNEKKKK